MFSDDITKKIAAAAAQIKTEPTKNVVNGNSVEGAVVSIMANEELKGNQHKIDANKNGKIDAHDFKLLRGKKKMNEDDTGYQDRYAVKSGKAVKHNPMRGEKDEPHHVWADSPEHAVRKHAAKTKEVQEGVKGAGVGGALGAMAGGPVGAAIGGALGHVAGEVLSSAKNKTKAIGRIIKGPSMADSKLKKEDVESIEEAGNFIKGVKRFMAGKKNPSDVRDAHLAKSAFSSDPKVKEREGRRYDRVQNVLSKEEVGLDEAFPTVADAKKRMAAKDSSFEKKKISTGTVYSRKYKAEPEDSDDMPKKKAKTMKEMLDIYKNHGAESLIENLLIEEPTQDEYKKEVEVAQAKADGKIRNDKQIAKAASQGVKMEEVEQIDELVGKGKLPSIAAYHKQKSAEAKGKMETVRSSNTKLPVPKATSAKIFAKDAEAKYHSTQAKRADALMKKEEVELEMYDADEINNVQIDNIDERSLTGAEMNKREEIVKSMKKGIQGFKDRYGKDAKSVMYATATKNAMKD